MQMSDTLVKAFNEQITLELASSNAYLAISACLEGESFPGMAHWMKLQSDEERGHALKLIQFVNDRGAAVQIGAIEAPASSYRDPLEAFEAALAAEQRVTAAINDLYAVVADERDFASYPLLDWFVNEQVEEEASVSQIVDDLNRAQGDAQTLLLLDRELGARPGEE